MKKKDITLENLWLQTPKLSLVCFENAEFLRNQPIPAATFMIQTSDRA
jgi:hypothetical protein